MQATFSTALTVVLVAAFGTSGCSVLDPAPNPSLSSHYQSEVTRVDDLIEPEEKSVWEKVSPDGLKYVVKQVSGTAPDEDEARRLFDEADADFRVGTTTSGNQRISAFQAAADKFSDASKRWPESALEEDALFMFAESHFFADNYAKASQGYQTLIKRYPNTRYMEKVSARQFTLAEYWLQLHDQDPRWITTPNFTDEQLPRFDTFGNAVKILDRIRFDDPTGKLADDATMAAGRACFLKGKYRRAETFFDDLRKSFPDSEHQFDAHLLGLKCKMLTYDGPNYDGSVLDESENLVKRMFRLFPERAEQYRSELEQALRDVRLKKAEREWSTARYYDRRKEYGSARFHYAIVQREFGDTNLAKKATERLAELGGLPDDPPQRMAWLANLFPTPEEEKPLISGRSTGTFRR